MAEKICLDTDVCISMIKGDQKSVKLSDLIGSGKLFVTSITVFELNLRSSNLQEIQSFLEGILVLGFEEECAIKASNIYKELRSSGNILDFRDIFLAAIVIINNCSLITFNAKHFSRIKNLSLFDIEQ